MELKHQSAAIEQLRSLALADRHSILIEGIPGCGKSYLSKQYASMVGCEDVVVVDPTVGKLREIIESCYNIPGKIGVCIENLDVGVVSSSYTVLKFLEEPKSNVYVIVTCRNSYRVPDTIISRSSVITVVPPTVDDLVKYANYRDTAKYTKLKGSPIYSIVRSYSDIDKLFSFDYDKIQYLESLSNLLVFKDSVSTLSWNLTHFEDGSDIPLDIIIRYILILVDDSYKKSCCLDALNDLSDKRISNHAIISKLLLECKYGGY